jgi:uncharacterized membrane protein YccC
MLFEAAKFRATLGRVQWRRGLRAGMAVSTIMAAFYLTGRPFGWASLGVLQVLTVDNGGPYRSRLGNALTVIAGGSLAIFLGIEAARTLPSAIIVTALFCFAVTLARVVSQPLASSSVSILVAYIVAYGAQVHTTSAALSAVTYDVIGGLWAAAFSLVFWPVDPFRPARNAVADLYAKLTDLAAALPSVNETAPDSGRSAVSRLVPQIRPLIETAQTTLAATPARMTARTVRARNLAAMVQAADLLLARILRIAELGTHDTGTQTDTARTRLNDLSAWLVASLAPVEPALRQRPMDRGASFSAEGSLSVDMHRRALRFEASGNTLSTGTAISAQLDAQLAAAERDCVLSLEVVYEAVRAIWTGAEPRATRAAALRSSFTAPAVDTPSSPQIWLEALQANFTTRSVMFRHALRLAAVTAVDVVILHLIHLNHGYWLPMTSIIVLQPYTGETWQRSGDRVGGTVAGAVLAAILAATIPSETGIMTVICIGCVFTLATYAVDYAWYCFFLTPTIVLLTLPHLRDWHFAAVRMGMTGLGALTAIAAMLLFWPEREAVQLPRLLARAADADAAYIRAMLTFWRCPSGDAQARTLAERNILAPARRACGLATTDAEESLDRALLEHAIPLRATPMHERLNHDALTFTTYLRRLTQSITTLAVVGAESPQLAATVSGLAARLDAVSTTLIAHQQTPVVTLESASGAVAGVSLVDRQLARLERQVGVLERAAADIATAIPA